MKKLFVLLTLAAFAGAHAEQTYLSLYIGGGKIGWSSYSTHADLYLGKKVTRSDSKTLMDLGLLGQAMTLKIDSSSWTDSAGKPLKMYFVMTSSGRTQKVTAVFTGNRANVDIDNAGTKSKKTLTVPQGGRIVDDPLTLMVGDKAMPGARKVMYVLDPTTVTFMKNEVVLVGPATTKVKNRSVKATQINIIDPRATMKVFISSKGDLIKAEGPAGIEMIPEPKAVAMNGEGGYQPSADLAFTTSLRPDKPLKNPAELKGLKLRITGRDLSRIPSDEHQTVTKEVSSWTVDVHPPALADQLPTTIADAAKGHEAWLKPTLHIPADSAKFKALSATILKGETDVVKGVLAIKSYVQKTMQPNAGIGVLRDANEVLQTKEGVCRDYAILTATLLRAAGIPAKLASGLVNWDGDFYYHAWVEIWDGSHWVGIDSTTPDLQISAAHVKLAEGNVEEAFAFTFLEKVKVEVLDVRR